MIEGAEAGFVDSTDTRFIPSGKVGDLRAIYSQGTRKRAAKLTP
jgi:hypothetical protein